MKKEIRDNKWREHPRSFDHHNLSLRHRWNPVYPPGKPGKPHPVGCALSGDAEMI